MFSFYSSFVVIICSDALQSVLGTSFWCTHNTRRADDFRPSIYQHKHFDSKIRRFKSLYSPKIFASMWNRSQSLKILNNYLTMKTKIAFMFNLEIQSLLPQFPTNNAYFTIGIFRERTRQFLLLPEICLQLGKWLEPMKEYSCYQRDGS